jgi:hypothetical protein
MCSPYCVALRGKVSLRPTLTEAEARGLAIERRRCVLAGATAGDDTVTISFTDFGFAASYQIDINPEYPTKGGWGMPTFRFGGMSKALSVRIRPSRAKSWVASFALEADYLVGLFACPNPDQLLVAVGIDAYLVDATRPGDADDLPIRPVIHVQRPSRTDLLVVGSFTNLAAIDRSGLRWISGRLFIDDLELVEGPPGKICVRGSVSSVPSDPELLVIDPYRGELIEGRRYTDVAYPDGEPFWHRPGI